MLFATVEYLIYSGNLGNMRRLGILRFEFPHHRHTSAENEPSTWSLYSGIFHITGNYTYKYVRTRKVSVPMRIAVRFRYPKYIIYNTYMIMCVCMCVCVLTIRIGNGQLITYKPIYYQQFMEAIDWIFDTHSTDYTRQIFYILDASNNATYWWKWNRVMPKQENMSLKS